MKKLLVVDIILWYFFGPVKARTILDNVKILIKFRLRVNVKIKLMLPS
jgi:hypothetical protein